MVTAADLYTLLYRGVREETVAELCSVHVEDLRRICGELVRAGMARPNGEGQWLPGPSANEDVYTFQRQVYALGIDLGTPSTRAIRVR